MNNQQLNKRGILYEKEGSGSRSIAYSDAALCVRGVAAVLENKPKIVSHSVTPNASALQPTKITIDDNYADQVQVKDIIDK